MIEKKATVYAPYWSVDRGALYYLALTNKFAPQIA